MKFVFYQNILSIHQSSFIRNLAEYNEVTLVVEEPISAQRMKEGWNIPDFGKTEIIVAPSRTELEAILNQLDSIHIFSGLDNPGIPYVLKNRKNSSQTKIGILTESFRYTGFKGRLRYIKYLLLYLRWGKNIDFLLAIGRTAIECFKKIGFKESQLFNWAYFTEHANSSEKQLNNSSESRKAQLLFVGSIDERKNIIYLVSVCKTLANKFQKLTIIGIGNLESELKMQLDNCSFIEYIGAQNNNKVFSLMEQSDLLILPSKYDGWGAVVNEALSLGLPVLLSNHCGAKDLIDMSRGRVFSIEKNNLKDVLANYLDELPLTYLQRSNIKEWASINISGKVAVEYFDKIIDSVLRQKNKPEVPWLVTQDVSHKLNK